MKKHPARKSQPSEGRRGLVQQQILPLLDVIVSLKDGLREMIMSAGMLVLEAMLESDRQKLCGPKSKQQEKRSAHRHGYDHGQLVMGGPKVSLAKPLVRDIGGEVCRCRRHFGGRIR